MGKRSDEETKSVFYVQELDRQVPLVDEIDTKVRTSLLHLKPPVLELNRSNNQMVSLLSC